jgi:hypothetical protein
MTHETQTGEHLSLAELRQNAYNALIQTYINLTHPDDGSSGEHKKKRPLEEAIAKGEFMLALWNAAPTLQEYMKQSNHQPVVIIEQSEPYILMADYLEFISITQEEFYHGRFFNQKRSGREFRGPFNPQNLTISWQDHTAKKSQKFVRRIAKLSEYAILCKFLAAIDAAPSRIDRIRGRV